MTLPIIRLEVEGMRYQVIHAFAQHNEEVERSISAAQDRFIGSPQLQYR